jgi:hypothetical protein
MSDLLTKLADVQTSPKKRGNVQMSQLRLIKDTT